MKTSESVSIFERFRSQVKIILLFLFEMGTRKKTDSCHDLVSRSNALFSIFKSLLHHEEQS